MAEVKLFKKNVTYIDKDGQEKTATNFYVFCGSVSVPVEVKFFPDKNTGQDPRYRERKIVMTAFAEELPENKAGKKKAMNAAKATATTTDDISAEGIPF